MTTIANSTLPPSESSFLGRERELSEAARLQQRTRLLTVTGPGGAGKTRFALELARRPRHDSGDVVACFLAALRDPALVLPTIAQALSVAERPGQSALDALASQLEGRRVLLLVDNLEHLADCTPDLAALLDRCVGLTLLATSRAVLHVDGEAVYELPPLAEDEGVALFCERAGVEPSEAVRELSRRLEGLPLAIELAAARLRILTPEQLRERLSRRLDLLKAGGDVDPRQQTLRATIEWSHDLLDGNEQQLFARLSVFAGGCTLEAAEAVCDADVDTLRSLVEKSLLRVTDGRYSMLETIREYATDRLRAEGDVGTVTSRLASYLHASLAEPALADRARWNLALEAERDNLRVALTWALEDGDAETRLGLASAYGSLCMTRGPAADGTSFLVAALAEAPQQDTLAYARALWGLGALAWRQGETERCRQCHEACLAITRSIGERRLAGRALRALGILDAEEGHAAGSAARLNEALAVFRELGDQLEVDECLAMLGYGEMVRGDYPAARAHFEEAIASSRAAGHSMGVMRCASNLASIASREGRLDDALALSREGVLIAHELADLGSIAGCLDEFAFIAAERGSLRRSAILLGGSDVLNERTDLSWDQLELERRERARAVAARGLGTDAVEQLVAAGRTMSVDELVALALELSGSRPTSAS